MAVCVWRQTFNIRKATILMGVITMVILGSRTGLSWQPCVRIWLAVGGAHWLVLEHIGAARAIKPCIFLRERGTREIRNKGIMDFFKFFFFFSPLATYCCFYIHNDIINLDKRIIRKSQIIKRLIYNSFANFFVYYISGLSPPSQSESVTDWQNNLC